MANVYRCSESSHPTDAQDGLFKNRVNNDQARKVLQKWLVHTARELGCSFSRQSASFPGNIRTRCPPPGARHGWEAVLGRNHPAVCWWQDRN